MDFYQSNNDSQQQIPSSFRSFSKAESPSKFQREPNSNENRDFYQSDLSSPSRIHFQAPTPENTENDSFKVFVRVRPLENREQVSSNPKARLNIVKVEDNMLFVLNPYIGAEWSYKPEKSYVFTKAFDQDVKTVNIYEEAISSTIKNILNGFNSTILAYGMTGAGKTFTMFGDIYNIKGGLNVHPGVASLLVRDLFRTFERETDYEFKIKFSYLEIYNEHARDLLANIGEDLMIVEDSERGIVIPNLSEFYISSHEDIFRLILQGNSRRIMASTHANQFSSRSHAIMQLVVEKRSRTKDIVDTFLQSKLSLVDLAGSERAAVSENRGLRHREGANINRSLLALGNCINILSDPNKKGAYVPYRDSKLTRLLKDSLGGNTQTVFLACVSPSYQAYEESVNTLKYASRARNIQKKVVRNVKEVELHISEYKGIIDSLRTEVGILKQKLNQRDGQSAESTPSKVAAEYASKVNAALDELGKKLVSIFEENWEYTQSLNELRDLKTQNEELLKNKVSELGRTVGNIPLYNRISDEIVSLKEVMANNEKIQKEMEASLERSNLEKRSVQSQIFWIISHNPQSSEEMKQEICLEELARDSPLLNLESPTFRKIMHIPESSNEEAASRMYELLDEVQQMKKQLAEKDKLLVKNQEIIHSLLHTNTRPEPATTMAQYPSPSKEINSAECRESARWTDLTHRDEELKAIAASARINNIPATAQMTSISKINLPQGFTPYQDLEQIPSSAFSQSISGRRGPGEQYEQMMQGMASPQSGFYSQGKELFYQRSNKLIENPGDVQLSAGSLDDFNTFTTHMNRASLDNVREDIPADEKVMYQAEPRQSHYINEVYSPGPQSSNYKLSEQPLIESGDIYSRPYPKSLNTSTPYVEDASRNRIPKSPTNQVHQQQNFVIQPNIGDSYSPNLSSIIGHTTYDQSGDGSFKQLLSENLTVLGQMNRSGVRSTNKENLQRRELSSPKTAIPITSMHKKSPNRTSSTAHKKLYGTLSPDPTFKSKSQKSLKNIKSPNSGSILTKSVLPSSPERQIVYRTQERALASSLQLNQKPEEKLRYSIQDDIKSAKGSFAGSTKEKYDIRTTSSKSGNGNRNQPTNQFIQATKNMVQNGENKEKKSTYTILQNDPKTELKSLDTRREVVKGFRTKLHQLATAMDNNTIGTSQMKDIKTLIEEYRQNTQTYVLSAGDAYALRRLEDVLYNRPRDFSGNEWEISDVAKSKDSLEPLDDSADFDEGERAFGNVQVETKPDTEEKKSAPVPKETVATKDNKPDNEQKVPVQTQNLSTVENTIPVDRKKIIPLYVAFGFIIMAFIFNIISRLGAKQRESAEFYDF